jgi:hypothetical protein
MKHWEIDGCVSLHMDFPLASLDFLVGWLAQGSWTGGQLLIDKGRYCMLPLMLVGYHQMVTQ